MPATESPIAATDPFAEAPPLRNVQQNEARASKPLKNLLVGFAATVTMGLSLAVWYLTGRMVQPGEGTPALPSRAVVRSVGQAQAAVLPSAPNPEQKSFPEAYWSAAPALKPLYLEVASLGPREDAKFVKALHAKGFQAEIRSSASGDSRLLVGPFFSAAELSRAKTKLESTGVLAREVTHVLDP